MKFPKLLGFVSSFVQTSPASAPEKISRVDSVDKILLTAADLIEKNGWTQDRRYNAMTGGICIMEAIDRASNMYVRPGGLRGIFSPDREAANMKAHDKVLSLPMVGSRAQRIGMLHPFNDHPGITRKDVLTALRIAAAK